jgi:hypothetical protein
MVYLIGKLDQTPIIITFGKFDDLVILDKSIQTRPMDWWFFITLKMVLLNNQMHRKLGHQKNLIKK